ncbi:MAG: cupin domain-containing protein [Asgard group archaeon]|nr:cupin domain-containing protein [Asgard group archaeon]
MSDKKSIDFSKIHELASTIDYQDGSVVSKQVIKKKGGNVTLFSFDEGEGLSEHTAPFDALVYIMDGNAEITIAKDKFNLSTGQMIIMPANIPHALHAVKKFKMLLVMIKEES